MRRTTTPRERLNTVCPYYTMFPLNFPLKALADAGPCERVLDPFCGRGTTIFAARLLGLESLGVDVNPVAVAIAQAKLALADHEAVMQRAAFLIDRGRGTPAPSGEFWEWAYHSRTLADLAALRAGLRMSREDAVVRVLRALVLGVLHGPQNRGEPSYLSNQMPRSYATKPDSAVRYWSARDQRPPEIDLLAVLRRRSAYVLADPPAPGEGQVRLGDARYLRAGGVGKFSHIVTSPPYPGMRTYLPDQWLRSWFLGGAPHPEYGGQAGFGSIDATTFARALGKVWRAVARVSAPGARLTVRFGALPSVRRDPVAILDESLRFAKCGWRLNEVSDAPMPPKAQRQAKQFGRTVGAAEVEVDAQCSLAL